MRKNELNLFRGPAEQPECIIKENIYFYLISRRFMALSARYPNIMVKSSR